MQLFMLFRFSIMMDRSKTNQNKTTTSRGQVTSTSNKNRKHEKKSSHKIKDGTQTSRHKHKSQEKRKTKEDASEGATPPVVKFSPEIDAMLKKKCYQIECEINHGAFGTVFKAKRTNNQNEIVAVKMMDLAKMELSFREKYLAGELAALIRSRHDNIIQIYDFIRMNDLLFIFMEFASNGTVTEFVKVNGKLEEPQARFWFTQMVQALLYLHRSLRLAHRDIKLDNMLLDDNFQVKLSDFGFAKDCWDYKRHCVMISQTVCGTMAYFSPQVLRREPYNAFLYDSWAMGVSLYAMLSKRFPFHSNDSSLMLAEQTRYPDFMLQSFDVGTSKEAIDLVIHMLDPNEMTRFTLREVSEHVWIQSG